MSIAFPPDLSPCALPPRKKSLRGGYKIDRQHPLAAGLMTCFLFNEGTGSPHDIAGNTVASFSDSNAYFVSPNTNAALGIDINGNAGTSSCVVTAVHTLPGTITVFLVAARGIDTLGPGLYGTVQTCAATETAGTSNGWAIELGNGYGGTANALYTGGSCTALYVDGVAQSSAGTSDAALTTGQRYAIAAVFTVSDDPNPVYFGRFPATTGGQFGMTGSIEIALIYNRALSTTEIKQLYQQTRNGGLPGFVQQPGDTAWIATQSGLALAKALSEALALSDSRILSVSKKAVESLLLSDTRLAAFAKALSDPLVLADITTRGAGKGLAESLSLSDARTLAATRKLLESLSLSDAGVSAILNGGGQALSKLLTENLGVTDTLNRASTKALLESLSLSDARLISIGRHIAETLALTDARALGIMHKLAESLSITDNVNAFLGAFALYFFVAVTQSGYKADNTPSSDTTFGGQA